MQISDQMDQELQSLALLFGGKVRRFQSGGQFLYFHDEVAFRVFNRLIVFHAVGDRDPVPVVRVIEIGVRFYVVHPV
ncbi:MAG TPA: hypothetical protein VIL74_14620 [Pyrinomonadaceae bacterium]